MSDTKFHIRDAEPAKNDAQFILDAFDAVLPHLNATGSGRQWGSSPFSKDASRVEAVNKDVEEAEAYRRTGEGKLVVALVAEVDVGEDSPEHVERGERVPVAAITVKEGWWPRYIITEAEHLAQEIEEEKSWVYVHILISDFRAGRWRKGGGAALMAEVKERAKTRGFERLYLDCWAGNERKLVQFYEAQGYVWVRDFVGERPKLKDIGDFEGALLKMDL